MTDKIDTTTVAALPYEEPEWLKNWRKQQEEKKRHQEKEQQRKAMRNATRELVRRWEQWFDATYGTSS